MPPLPDSLADALAGARRALLIHRRGLAALCAGLAVWLGFAAAGSQPPVTVPLWTAAANLPSGTVLAASDFKHTGFAPGSVPAAAVHDLRTLVGRTLATPLSRGEVAVRGQVLGNRHLEGYPGRSAIALRIPDADAAALLRPGDQVDLVASDPQQHEPARRVVEDAIVLVVPRTDDSASGNPALTGRLVVFAVPTADVDEVAGAGASLFLSVIWNR
jgi:Flp pilus assembly protein CpaB